MQQGRGGITALFCMIAYLGQLLKVFGMILAISSGCVSVCAVFRPSGI